MFSSPLQRKSYKTSFNFKFPGMSQIDPVGDVSQSWSIWPARQVHVTGICNLWDGECYGSQNKKGLLWTPFSGVWSPIVFWHFVVFFFDPGSHNIHPNWSQTHYVAQACLKHGIFLTLSLTCIITNIYHHAQQWQLLHDHFITICLSHSNALNISP